MEPKLGGVRDLIEEFLQDRELLRARLLAPERGLPLPRLFHGYRELTRIDTFHEVREALEGQPAGSEAHRRLSRLCSFLLELAVEARSAEADERFAAWEASSTPWPDEPGLLTLDARRRVVHEKNRGRRTLLARAIARELEGQDRLLARRVEAVHEVAGQYAFSSPLAVYARFGSVDFDKLATEAQALLARTDDAYRDLLGYVLRRIEPTLRPQSAERHDLDHALLAPWTFPDTGAGELAQATRRWIEEWGIAAGAGRLELELGERAGKPDTAQVVAQRVPDRIFASARTEVGVTDALTLLRTQGAALSFALRDRRLPLEDRRLTDGRTQALFAACFARLLVDARWLERYLRVPKSGAKELARVFAFAELTRAREGAARLTYELELLRRGPEAELRDVYEDIFRKALAVSVPRGASLHGLSPHLSIAAELRGQAVAAALLPSLRERFDEDYWRNPNAAGFLRDVAARGPLGESLAAIAPKALEAPVTDSAAELIAAMGA